MAEDIARLGLKIDSKDIIKATKRLDKLENQSRQTEKQAKKTTGAFKGMGAALGALGLGLAFKSIISLTIEQERVTRQLDAAIKSTGGSAGFTSLELQEMAAGLQKVTNFGDEAILGMQSLLLTFTNLKGDILPATTMAVLDLSERMGTDLQSSALQLAKALNDPIANLGALSRAGIQFSVDQKAVIKSLWEAGQQAEAQKIILKELEVQFGGSAKAARDSFGGALKSLGNAFNDLLEGDGGLNDAKGAVEELITVLQKPETKEAFDVMVTAIVAVTTALAAGVVGLTEFGDSLGVFLAGGDGKRSLEELDEGILVLEGRIEKFKSGLKESKESGAIVQFLMGSPEDFKKQILDATIELELLQMARDGLTKKDGMGGDDEESPIVAQARNDIEAISEMELDAALDKAIREQEEMERLFDFNEVKLAIEMDYYDRLFNMQAGSQQAAFDFTESLRDNDLKGALKHGSLMLSNMSKTNKAAFEVQKAFALANAIVTLPSAVMKSFDNGGGYPWGLIPAGLMLAQGLSQISAIQSTSFGSKSSSGGGIGGASTSPSAPVASGLPPGSTAVPSGDEVPTQQVSITLNGAGYSRADVRELLESINEEIGDGATLIAA